MFYVRNPFVPSSKHSMPRLYETSRVMLHKAKVAAFFSENHTQHIHAT